MAMAMAMVMDRGGRGRSKGRSGGRKGEQSGNGGVERVREGRETLGGGGEGGGGGEHKIRCSSRQQGGLEGFRETAGRGYGIWDNLWGGRGGGGGGGGGHTLNTYSSVRLTSTIQR
ncbi:hypothetical protein KC19_3G264100 [Ceratodon purpureus]|uniref:Uncharacterized protein n=1 Tax=Ceratodon purpureus TaxID=3225 RepID=A0A8T0IRZ6_CERPU|nr:hypothetical protein KC19_3G264100 [Ceratodon purpureus]